MREIGTALRECLDRFPKSIGCRNSKLLPQASCYAVRRGMSEEEFEEAIHSVAPDMTRQEILHAYRSAKNKIGSSEPVQDNCHRNDVSVKINLTALHSYKNHVANLIKAGSDIATLDGLMGLSPVSVSGLSPWEQMETQMTRLFPDASSHAYVFWRDSPRAGSLGRNIKRISEWLDCSKGMPDGDVVAINPLSGAFGKTKEGKLSLIAESCLAGYSNMLLEFDKMSLEDQCRFWAGFIRKSKLPLKCLVFSGNKSIHGCIDIRAGDANKYAEDKRKIESLFAASLNPAFCVDTAAMRPRTGMRLAGVIRRDSGKEQTLLWACNLDGNSPQTRQNAPSAPYGASGRVGCAVDAPKQETCPAGILAQPAGNWPRFLPGPIKNEGAGKVARYIAHFISHDKKRK